MAKEKTDSQKVEAGKARAESMSPSERKSLASRAAHARWKRDPDGVAIATHEGNWPVGDVHLSCAVLKDGRRIFSERSLSEAFTHIRSGSEYKLRLTQPVTNQLPVFVNKTIAGFLSPTARERLANPIRYRHIDGFSVPARGIEADLLPELCEAYLAAREAGALEGDVAHRKARAAERLLRALAKVGVVAIVDEVTGFQVERDRDELQRLLERYVNEEFRPWTQMFPGEFYVQIFRLRGITTADVRKRPAYFGKLTNNIVYDRMLPGMLERLRHVNPTSEANGRRARRHHQHLSEDGGVQHLRDHLAGVVFLMRSSPNWASFMRSLDLAAPRRGDTLVLPLALDADADARGTEDGET